MQKQVTLFYCPRCGSFNVVQVAFELDMYCIDCENYIDVADRERLTVLVEEEKEEV